MTTMTRLRSTQESGGSSCPRLSPGRRLCLKQSCRSTHRRTVVDANDQSLIPTAQGGRVATHGVDPHMYGVSRADDGVKPKPLPTGWPRANSIPLNGQIFTTPAVTGSPSAQAHPCVATGGGYRQPQRITSYRQCCHVGVGLESTLSTDLRCQQTLASSLPDTQLASTPPTSYYSGQ